MLQIPQCEPQRFVAGDTVQWTKSLADFPPSAGWALKYRMINAVAGVEILATKIVATANAAGSWDVAIAAADSSVPGGVWRLIGWVVLAATGERHTVFDAMVTVLADATVATPDQLHTDNEKTLAAIDARLMGRATADQEQVQINGTSLVRIPIKDLRGLRGIYAAAVWREQNEDVSNPTHLVRFARAR